jgi:hypothetical protein
MAISYTWKVNNLERDVADDYVTTVHYGVDATDGEHSKGITGTVNFTPETSAASIDYAALTEEQVLSWVYSQVSKEDTEAMLAAKVEKLKAPTKVSGLIWVERAELFAQQLAAYKQAVARLEQYVVADGRVELTEMQATGEQVFNEDTMEMDDVMHEVVVQSAIEAVEPTVEVTTYSDDIDAEPTVETVTNPLIVADEAERAEAQGVVDATPNDVKDD